MIEQITVNQAIINCLSYYSKIHKINYLRLSEATIQRFIRSRYGIIRSIQTISRHVNKLAHLGYFEIQRRNPILKNGVLCFQTNLYRLKGMIYKSVYFVMKSSESALKGVSKFYKHKRAKVSKPDKLPAYTTYRHRRRRKEVKNEAYYQRLLKEVR